MRIAALAFGCAFAGIAWLWFVSEAMSDPGGLAAVGLVALVTVPLLALAALSWIQPDAAVAVLAVLMAFLIVAGVLFAVDLGGWRTLEHDHGPVRAIGVLVLLPALATLGWRRPHVAGLLLVTVGLVPVLAASVGAHGGSPSMLAVAVPATIDGILFLLARDVVGSHPVTHGA